MVDTSDTSLETQARFDAREWPTMRVISSLIGALSGRALPDPCNRFVRPQNPCTTKFGVADRLSLETGQRLSKSTSLRSVRP